MQAGPARLLWNARLAGATVDPADLAAITDEAAAYVVQTDTIAMSNSVPLGWKLGATSTASQQALGLDGPFYGPLFASFCFADGATVPDTVAFGPGGEGEIALVLGRDLAPADAPYDEAAVADAVAAACVALEIAGTRLAGGLLKQRPAHLIADDAANVAFVRGALIEDWRGIDLAGLGVALSINGEVKAHGKGVDVLGGPLTALTWFANAAAARGLTLAEGQTVTTGTCTGFVPLKSGDDVVVDGGALGTVRATLG